MAQRSALDSAGVALRAAEAEDLAVGAEHRNGPGGLAAQQVEQGAGDDVAEQRLVERLIGGEPLGGLGVDHDSERRVASSAP